MCKQVPSSSASKQMCVFLGHPVVFKYTELTQCDHFRDRPLIVGWGEGASKQGIKIF